MHRYNIFFFFFNDTATTEIYTLSLHDALPIFFVCLSMVQLMAVFISMRCTLCGHFLQVALTLILKTARSEERFSRNAETDLVCRLLLEKKKNGLLSIVRLHIVPSSYAHLFSTV